MPFGSLRPPAFAALAALAWLTIPADLAAQDPSRGARLGGKRYWADPAAGALRRSNLDGSSPEDVVGGLSTPYGVSVDPVAGAVLWTNSGDETVGRWDPANGRATTLQTAFEEPYAIVMDEGSRQVAYAIVDGDVIRAIQEDLSEEETVQILIDGDPGPEVLRGPEAVPPIPLAAPSGPGFIEDPPPLHGLALDAAAGILYVGDGNGMMARRVRLSDGRVDDLEYEGAPVPVAGGKR